MANINQKTWEQLQERLLKMGATITPSPKGYAPHLVNLDGVNYGVYPKANSTLTVDKRLWEILNGDYVETPQPKKIEGNLDQLVKELAVLVTRIDQNIKETFGDNVTKVQVVITSGIPEVITTTTGKEFVEYYGLEIENIRGVKIK